MRIANNISALKAFNILNSTNSALQKTIRALSSGLRINSAADDASGLAISEKMRSQIGGLDKALQNTQDGISLLQTADGALNETAAMLQRMRELSVQAANDTLTQQDRSYIQVELDQIKDEINRTAKTTQFNKKKILNGEAGALWSSSDLGVRANIHGAIGGTDQFGQYVSADGNYDLEISVQEYGQAQVQKSSVINVADYGITVEWEELTEPITQTVYEIEEVTDTIKETVKEMTRVPVVVPIREGDEVPHIIFIDEKRDSLNETKGDGWAFYNNTLEISGDGVYDVRGTQGANASACANIVVTKGADAKIFLTDVNINKSNVSSAALKVEADASAHIYLTNTNTLTSGGGHAGLEVGDGASVYITSAEGNGLTSGRLSASGSSQGGAGIGGPGSAASHDLGRSGTITIAGGTIEAKGSLGSAGIGGGNTYGADGGGTITIMGGNIFAYGGSINSVGGAGIGSGFCAEPAPGSIARPCTSDNTVINIYGGTVKAYGGNMSAGIGGSAYTSAGTITINEHLRNNGSVTAAAGGTGAQRIGYGGNSITNQDNNINLKADIECVYDEIPDRPKIASEIIGEEIQYVEQETETTVERLVTRKVERKIDKIIGTRVIDRIPIVKGLDGDFDLQPPKTLQDISSFTDENGVFLLTDPQKITITQGNGKTASLTVYANDTMYDVAEKINKAISEDLGQSKYLGEKLEPSGLNNNFCTISDGTEQTSESVEGFDPIYSEAGFLSDYGFNIPEGTLLGYKVNATMLVRSIIPGKEGELSFSGNEDFLNVLGLNTITQSSETTYSTTVREAHSGSTVIQNLKSTGSKIHGLIHDNVDVEFDPMSATVAAWDSDDKKYRLISTGPLKTTLHLADNSLKLQVGANEGERFILDLGDMSADALGVSKVNVSTHDTAARAITIIDNAIDIVNTQRAKIGASTNTLEHTMSSLAAASENLTQAESRIRDADIAKMMLAFTKYQIMSQSGVSMLSQANQFPQQVLSLIR